MSSTNGNIYTKFAAIALFLVLILRGTAEGQESILDSTFTFNAGTVRTGSALDIITQTTGYNFSYDNRLIDQDRKTEFNFNNTKLSIILDSILKNDSLVYSVIDRYIIISHAEQHSLMASDTISPANIKYITGKIIDGETSDPLPFAAVALKHKGKGTVTNKNGDFGMKITPEYIDDTLSVSYLGYTGIEMPVRKALGINLTLKMKREYISIPEIIIKNQNPQEIINKALKAIPRNYGTTPALMTGFYREGVLKKSELQTYSEAILQIYKSAYSPTIFGDQIKVYKSRKIDNVERTDTLAIRLKAGLSTCLDLDGAKNTFDFLSPESMPDYTYRMTDIVTYDDESAYAIDFEQRENVDIPLFKGTIYINTTDYGIFNAEFEVNPRYIHKMKDTYITTSSRGFNTWPTSVKYSVSYRKMNNRYFLNHVRGDLTFSSSQKRKLFNTQFKVFFELAITEVELNNVTRFDREELAPIHSVFSRTINSYDAKFWGNQDFLKPEDNLLRALKNMNVNLQEFTK
jgi:CarboxypepD_reg-like domain